MRENDAKLNRCRNLLAVPPKVDRNKTAPKCRCCPYFQPEFRYRMPCIRWIRHMRNILSQFAWGNSSDTK